MFAMKNYLVVFLAGMLTLSACKEEVLFREDNAPVITVLSPADSMVYAPGDTLHIKVNFTDDSKVQAYTVNVKSGNSIFLYNGIPNENDSIVMFDTTIVLPPQQIDYQIQLYCEDKYANFTNKIVPFSVQ